ncbi:MAG: hypothetical protein WA888_16445 [Burkholderiaceae bacterium]
MTNSMLQIINRVKPLILMPLICSALGLFAVAGIAQAGEADVLKAVVSSAGKQFRFDVTVRSNDKGWDYYCDRFEILSPDGQLLGTRILHHPHESEQPFTRSSDAIEIDAGIDRVVVRARMKPSGASGETVTVKVPGR